MLKPNESKSAGKGGGKSSGKSSGKNAEKKQETTDKAVEDGLLLLYENYSVHKSAAVNQ